MNARDEGEWEWSDAWFLEAVALAGPGAGLLRVDGGRFALTSMATELRGRSASSTVFDRMTWLHGVLVGRVPGRDRDDWQLDATEYTQALQTYLNR